MHKPVSQTSFTNISSDWFRASEAAGDTMTIVYGRIPKGSGQIEWFHLSHCECDGIGGFTRLLRERGIKDLTPPKTKHPFRKLFAPLWNRVIDSISLPPCANRSDWKHNVASASEDHPVGWHLFTKEETQRIIDHCRELQVTVNSFLLKQLDQSIRQEILRPKEKISWMIPVNLRGDIEYPDDTANHVSCIEPKIAADDTPQSIQTQILHRLKRGEHRANFLLLSLGGIFSHATKVRLLQKDRTKPAGNIGAFSNLGVWEIDPALTADEGWVFCPPRVTGQLLGAGCVTFNGRLGLATQGKASPERMERWVRNIGEHAFNR